MRSNLWYRHHQLKKLIHALRTDAQIAGDQELLAKLRGLDQRADQFVERERQLDQREQALTDREQEPEPTPSRAPWIALGATLGIWATTIVTLVT